MPPKTTRRTFAGLNKRDAALLTRADDALRGREPTGLVDAARERYVGLLLGNHIV